MKIALIGPGIIPIPPLGWGAVEILIWDYYLLLTEKGHKVTIINPLRSNPSDQQHINTDYCQKLIATINQGKYDFVHFHYDCLFFLLPLINCPNIGITSHYPYIDQPNKHCNDGFAPIYQFLVSQTRYKHFVLAEKDRQALILSGAKESLLYPFPNGIRASGFEYILKPILEKTIYLGKITPRKNQAVYQFLNNVDFVGDCADERFNTKSKYYLGSWTREKIHSDLTNYTNLLLVSEGEADPLVVKEALITGLGVVINRGSCVSLFSDPSEACPFITVLDDSKLGDLNYVQSKIKENSEICHREGMRMIIRNYALKRFDFVQSGIIDHYIDFASSKHL